MTTTISTSTRAPGTRSRRSPGRDAAADGAGPRGMRLGYARVSTAEQNLDHQLDALERAGCARIFSDKASGKLARRPQWDVLLEQLRPGDELVITRLDRAGRSVAHLVELAADLAERDVALVVTDQGIDTGTPAGRLTFHILAALGEFSVISTRRVGDLPGMRAAA